MTDLRALVEDVQAGTIGRRAFLTRSMALGLSFATASELFAACGGSTSTGSSPSVSKDLSYATYASTPLEKKVVQSQVDDYQKKTGGKVKINFVPGSDYPSSVRTYLSSNTPPDVLAYYGGLLAQFFINRNLIQDVSDVWEKNNWTAAFPESFQNVSKGKDGKFYFLPRSWYWWAVFYRKSVFSKYNLTPPKTFDEFYKVCDTLKSNGLTPIVTGSKAPWPLAGWFDILNLRINGPQFHMDLTSGKAHYTDARVKKVFTIWKDMIKKGYFIKSASSYTWDQVVPQMVRGQAGMYVIGRFLYDEFPKNLQSDLGFFSFPAYDASIPLAEEAPVDGAFIPKKAKNIQAGKDFLSYLGSAEGQKLYITSGGDSLAANTQLPPSTYNAFDEKGTEFLKQAKVVTQFYDRDTETTVATRGMAFFGQFFDNPDGNLDQGLADLDNFAQSASPQS